MAMLARLAILLILGLLPATRGFNCVPVTSQSSFCGGITPNSVCAVGESVDGAVLTQAKWEQDKNATCPANPSLFTKSLFCQGPWLPCTDNDDCSKKTHKRCFDLCMNGGTAANRHFLGANQCAKDMYPATYCNARVEAGEVAAPGDEHCIGLTDFQKNHGRNQYGHTVWIPNICRATIPLADYSMADFSAEARKEFMLGLADVINGIWGLSEKDDEHKFVRGTTLRARRLSVNNEVITIFVEAKQVCLAPFRQGKWMWTSAHGKATNLYCDVPGPDPHQVFTNLSALINQQDQDEGLHIVDDFWIKQEYRTIKPVLPTQCFPWRAEEEPNPPDWVWCIVSVSGCLLLLSLLVLQHRWRNSIGRVRANQKLREYS